MGETQKKHTVCLRLTCPTARALIPGGSFPVSRREVRDCAQERAPALQGCRGEGGGSATHGPASWRSAFGPENLPLVETPSGPYLRSDQDPQLRHVGGCQALRAVGLCPCSPGLFVFAPCGSAPSLRCLRRNGFPWKFPFAWSVVWGPQLKKHQVRAQDPCSLTCSCCPW